MPEILGDFRNRPLEQDEMDAWRVSLAVDGDVLLDIGLAAPALDHNGRFPDYGARQVPAMSVTDKDPHRFKVRYRDYLPVSL